jgi:hypothetical protein
MPILLAAVRLAPSYAKSATDLVLLRQSVIESVSQTSRTLFPEPVLLESYESSERERVAATFRRFRRGAPACADLPRGVRLEQPEMVGVLGLQRAHQSLKCC